MQFVINTSDDGPDENHLSIHAQVMWLTWSDSSTFFFFFFKLSQDENFEAIYFPFLFLNSGFGILIAFQHNWERQRGNLRRFLNRALREGLKLYFSFS